MRELSAASDGSHAACRAEIAAFRGRWQDHPASGLRRLAETLREDRRAVRLGQNCRADGINHALGHQASERIVHPDMATSPDCRGCRPDEVVGTPGVARKVGDAVVCAVSSKEPKKYRS